MVGDAMPSGVRRRRLRDAGLLNRTLEQPLERLVVKVITPYHWERESIECIACRNTQDHGYDAPARGCLHSNASGMNTPPRPRA